MRKYLAIFRTALQSSITWRGAFWFYIALSFLPLIGYYFLWTAVFSERSMTAGFSYEQLLTYAVIAMIFTRLTWISPEYGVMENIREGTLTKYLVQPMSYFGYYWSSRIAFRTFALVLTAPFILLTLWILRQQIQLPGEGWQWWYFLAAMPVAIGLQFYLGMFIGLMAFWMEEARYLQLIKDSVLALLGGLILPFAFFPEMIQRLFSFLPFQFLASAPVNMFLGRVEQSAATSQLLIGTLWVVGLHFAAAGLWRRVLRRFIAVGN